MGVTSAKDIANEIPNVTITQAGDSAIQVTIRGITSSNTTEIGDPAVGLSCRRPCIPHVLRVLRH